MNVQRFTMYLVVLAALLGMPRTSQCKLPEVQAATAPIHIHPENSKIFEFRGKPRVLICATEHYGAVMNRPFRFERYLADAAEKSQTLTRLFILFRELQSAQNPYSTCKPESPDYIAPFKRVGPDSALDGQLRYDLSQWNPEFFSRLHRFLSLASDYGIVVEVVLLSNTYAPQIWALNPLNTKNNINDVEEINWPEYMTMRHSKMFGWQQAVVKKVVQETNKYDNIFYEICNEPGGGLSGANNPSTEEVDQWLTALAEVVRRTEAPLANKHLIVGQQAFHWQPWEQLSDKAFSDFFVEVVNIHPLPNTTYRGKAYDMGQFMSKQLKLRQLRDYCLAVYPEQKPLNLDEDNVASQYKDYDGWTIHRKRAWVTLFSGAHYDYIDFSIIPYCETGTPESRKCIRTWMKHLSEYIHSVDLVKAKPMPQIIKQQPENVLACVFAVPGKDYNIYLADERELENENAGEPIKGRIVLELAQGRYRTAAYSPATGLYSPWTTISGGPNTTISLPVFKHDIVIRIRSL